MEQLSLPSSPQISFAVEFGASEGGLMVSLWPNASCPLDLEVLPFHPPHKMAKNLKMSQIPKISNEPKLLCCGSVGCQLSLCPDGSCPGSTLVPSKNSSKTRSTISSWRRCSQLTLKQNSIIVSSFISARLK